MKGSRVVLLALSLLAPSTLSSVGCGSANGCPTGYLPVMGVCVPTDEVPDAGRVGDAGPGGPLDDAGLPWGDDARVLEAPDAPTDTGCAEAPLFADADGDGFGDPSAPLEDCVASREGYVTDASDCDDACADCHPGASEICNGADDDCDGEVDDGVMLAFFVDADGDGFGTGNAVRACSAPAGHSATAGDCDDACPSCHPGGTESCNGADDDCDGAVDDGVTTTFYVDADGDGYGRDDATMQACTVPAGHAARAGDCDDATGTTHPGATETCNDVDDDCDGSRDEGLSRVVYRVDCDRDGFTPATGESFESCRAPTSPPVTCPTGAWLLPTPAVDCHDGIADAHPGQTVPFATPMASLPTTGLRFDYDCNGVERLQEPNLVDCTRTIYGWHGWVPACGVTAPFDACGFGTANRTQLCR